MNPLPSSRAYGRTAALLLGLALAVSGIVLAPGAAAHGTTMRPWTLADIALIRQLRAPRAVPPLPVGTALLKFEEFFERPIGPRGLLPTARLRSLDGQRVRIFGYMVQREAVLPGRFILAQAPVTLADQTDGAADDLPPAIVYVQFPALAARQVVPYAPGLLMVEGRLRVGAADEPDGRISLVRLELELPPAPAAQPAGE